MSNPSAPTMSTAPQDVSLKDLLDLVKKDIMLSLNCHAIGVIQSFNSSKQTVAGTVAYKKTRFTFDPQTATQKSILQDYPPIIDCPAIVLGGGKASLTFPIEQGDECVFLFNDRDFDTWLATSQTTAPNPTTRYHSFSDAIALVGIRSQAKALTTYDSTRAVLQYGTTLVGVSQNKVKIANQLTTLNTLLQSLITTLNSLTTTPTVPGNPATLSPATILQLTNLGTQIGSLLE